MGILYRGMRGRCGSSQSPCLAAYSLTLPLRRILAP